MTSEHHVKEENSNVRQALPGIVGAAGGILSLIVALITCGAVVLHGGQYTRQIDVDTKRITELETRGTPSMQTHEKLDQERVDSLKARVAALENAVIVISDVRGQIGVLNERMATACTRMQSIEDRIASMQKNKP